MPTKKTETAQRKRFEGMAFCTKCECWMASPRSCNCYPAAAQAPATVVHEHHYHYSYHYDTQPVRLWSGPWWYYTPNTTTTIPWGTTITVGDIAPTASTVTTTPLTTGYTSTVPTYGTTTTNPAPASTWLNTGTFTLSANGSSTST